MLSKHSTMHCFGHVHQPNPTVVLSSSASSFMVQGGALYERDGQYNGYSYISISDDGSHIVGKYRTYYVDRQEFDIGTNVAPDGAFYNPPNTKSFWDGLPLPPTNDDVCLWLLETADAVAKELNVTITGRLLSETFVEPSISKRPHADETASRNERSL
ncbi:hypothetical protein [Bradyrhizobium jicamae]|uniref:hypothetical protein n=1 Tax=Bradyrhizobium jicamae TaxID=280332 RepID=UPI0012ECC416|nr:hypothetical protein [Bradyrhizobium jicamae]